MGEAQHDPRRAAAGDGGDSVDECSAEAHPVGPEQHFGPLTINRLVRPDGRTLILYERTHPEGDPR